MTKLISLSVPLTAFKRTLSHHPPCPPPIPPSFLCCRVDASEKNSRLIHFGILPTLLPESHLSSFLFSHPVIPSLSLYCQVEVKERKRHFTWSVAMILGLNPVWQKKYYKTLKCVPNNIPCDSSSAVCVLQCVQCICLSKRARLTSSE